jgi:tetratricopeptide (TPR) repeat protein
MNEQTQLAEALLAQGELCLLKRERQGLELFKKASDLDPQNPDLFLKQAAALYEYGYGEKDEKILLLASKKLKIATSLDSKKFSTWHLWGNILSCLGKVTGRHHFFLQAKEKLTKAIQLSSAEPSDVLANLHWEYGLLWKHSAAQSKEALDLQLTISALSKAANYCDQLPVEFWHAFGQTFLDLSHHIHDIRLYVKAINCFKQCVSKSKSFYDGWTSLAQALHLLYKRTHDEDHFAQANECFSSAAQLHSDNEVSLWLHWAQFLCESGRQHRDIKKLRACIEKCQRAQACHPSHPLVMGVWAEALALLGELSDQIELIYEAQNKICEISQSADVHPDVWFSYGMCLNSFARYFDDIDYSYQAIEKFQQGLSIDRTCHRHWHAIANAYTYIGLQEEDPEYLERACRFHTKATALHTSTIYIYNYALTLSQLGDLTQEQKYLEESVLEFERALKMQKNAIYLHPEWLFHYAITLDMLGDFYEEKSYYTRAIEILSHVLMIDPDFPNIHHRLAVCYSHLADLLEDTEHFTRAIHHHRLSFKYDEENDQILSDWSTTLISLAQFSQDGGEIDQLYREAEHKLTQAAKLGNIHAFYQLSCLYSLTNNFEKSLLFLEKADQFNGLPSIEELLEDDWLSDVRATSDFRSFLSRLEKRPHLHEER